MPFKLYESGTGDDSQKKETAGASTVVTGTVINNCDLIHQGKVLVRIPSLDLEVWARLSTIGGGSDAGILYVPRVDDEVLVACSQGDPDDAFVLGGLWGTTSGPPTTTPLETTSKRVIKTGLTKGVGHALEFDDIKQSITLLSTTKQQVTIDPLKIELTNTDGTLVITLDNTTHTITIKGVNVKLEAAAKLELKGGVVSITSGPGPLTISGKGMTSISGKPVKLN
jgi:uncharacterized protein involved in type VI secretion and phage assembly